MAVVVAPKNCLRVGMRIPPRSSVRGRGVVASIKGNAEVLEHRRERHLPRSSGVARPGERVGEERVGLVCAPSARSLDDRRFETDLRVLLHRIQELIHLPSATLEKLH